MIDDQLAKDEAARALRIATEILEGKAPGFVLVVAVRRGDGDKSWSVSGMSSGTGLRLLPRHVLTELVAGALPALADLWTRSHSEAAVRTVESGTEEDPA